MGGGNCLKYLKMRWNKKEGGEARILKGGSKLAQGLCALKSWGWNPLANYVKTM